MQIARVAGMALIALLLHTGCARHETRQAAMPETTRVAAPARPAPAPPPPPRPHYRALKLAGDHALTDLENALGAHKFALFLKVNRIDLSHVRDTDTLAVPDSSLDTLDLAPFPLELASAASIPKLLLVSLRVQAFAAYENGRLVHWGPVSTGKKTTPTPAGLYHANWKAKQRYSTVDDSWFLKWCVNIEVHEGISLHEYELPGRPASHSCVRLAPDDAEWVYGWVDQWRLDPAGKLATPGTAVLVFGDYAWGARAPWKDLAQDPLAASVALGELAAPLRLVVPAVASGDSAVAPGAVAPGAVAPADTSTVKRG
ncbi:MAG TPA: L,D-transpeptidase [Candidatus Eisenbacteria bacterium]|nr:L,D-transpeptidase [Candidatus Eisenbacteria bacterium]